MQPAVIPGAACGITMVRKTAKPPAPRSYAASIRALSRLLQTRDERNHHEQHRGIHQADQDGRVVIQQFDRHGRYAELDQQRGQHSGLAQQNHPAERAHRLADPERNQAQNEQQPARPPLNELCNDPGDRECQKQREEGRDDRHHRRAHEHVPIQRFEEKRLVLGQAGHILARSHAFAEGKHREVDVRQYDQSAEPEHGRRQQQSEPQPPVPPRLQCRASHPDPPLRRGPQSRRRARDRN